MRCSAAKKMINQYIDGNLDSGKIQSIKTHLDTCRVCQKLHQDLLKIKQNAGVLENLSPSANVWTKIKTQLDTDKQEVLAPAQQKRSWFTRPAFQFAAGAAFVLVIVAGLSIWGPLFRSGENFLTLSEQEQFTLSKLEEAEKHYLLAIKALEEAAAAQAKDLDPDVAEIFRAHLEVVNMSIAACKQAVLGDPEDLDSRSYLLAAYKKKTDLINQMLNYEAGSPSPGIKDTI
jgi:hypothetical protein